MTVQELYENWVKGDRYFKIKEIEANAKKIHKQRNRERLNNQLKPCPFCGGKAEITNVTESDGYCHYETVKVKCTQCHASTITKTSDGYYGLYCSDEEIAGLWNQRV